MVAATVQSDEGGWCWDLERRACEADPAAALLQAEWLATQAPAQRRVLELVQEHYLGQDAGDAAPAP